MLSSRRSSIFPGSLPGCGSSTPIEHVSLCLLPWLSCSLPQHHLGSQDIYAYTKAKQHIESVIIVQILLPFWGSLFALRTTEKLVKLTHFILRFYAFSCIYSIFLYILQCYVICSINTNNNYILLILLLLIQMLKITISF